MGGCWLCRAGHRRMDGRYEAFPLAGAEGSKGGGRAFILDTRDGHVWIWSENELDHRARWPPTLWGRFYLSGQTALGCPAG